MLASFRRGEGELPLGGSSLRNDAVVVVEQLLDRDEDVQGVVRLISLRVGHVLFCSVMSYRWSISELKSYFLFAMDFEM